MNGTNMKPPKTSADLHARPKGPGPQHGPLHAQTNATPGRDKVRQVAPVRAPRESKRPVERTHKGRTGT